jgi:flavodoxin/NAD-dependent dihydropyrimidine dehydrogenase PreA subunit
MLSNENVLLVYFSGSGSTKAVSELLRTKLAELGSNVTMVDLSISTKAEVIDDFQLIVLGTPTYHCSPPRTVMEFINKISCQKNNKRVFLFCTYGLYPGNNLRRIAQKLLSKNITCIGFMGIRGPAADATMMFPQWIKFMYRYEKRTKQKLENAVKKMEEAFSSTNSKQRIPSYKWYAPLDYIPNQVFARRKFINQHSNKITLIDDRWDGKVIQCPRNCWKLINGKAVYHAKNCEFCMRCIHRTPNKAVVFSDTSMDRLRLDEKFYEERKNEIGQMLKRL